jgi:hypothetical protein
MDYSDIWNSDVFKAVTMTKALNKIEYTASMLEKSLDWTDDVSYTTDFGFDIEANSIYLLPITARGGQLGAAARSPRAAVKLPIPRYGESDVIINDSLLGVRETGEINWKSVESVRAQHLALTQKRIIHTSNYAMVRALDGKVVDGTTGLITCDLHVLLGTRQQVATLDFTINPASGGIPATPVTDKNVWFAQLKRIIEDSLGGDQDSIDKILVFCGRNFYRGLHVDPQVKAIWTDFTVKNALLRFGQSDHNVPGGFVLADNVWFLDAGNMRLPGGSNGFIDDSSAYVVPVFADHARRMYGPSTMGKYIGQVLPFYADQELLKFNRGIEYQAESIQLTYFKRPDLNIKVVGTNIVLPADITGLTLSINDSGTV